MPPRPNPDAIFLTPVDTTVLSCIIVDHYTYDTPPLTGRAIARQTNLEIGSVFPTVRGLIDRGLVLRTEIEQPENEVVYSINHESLITAYQALTKAHDRAMDTYMQAGRAINYIVEIASDTVLDH